MNTFILLFVPGPLEIIIILVIVVVLFGGRKIPELMKGVGQGMKEFKKATRSDDDDEKKKKDSDKIDKE